jgi:hypothetical protein
MERFLFLFCFLHSSHRIGRFFLVSFGGYCSLASKKELQHLLLRCAHFIPHEWMGGGKWWRASAKAKRIMLATILYSVLCLLSRVEKYMKQACRTFVFLA